MKLKSITIKNLKAFDELSLAFSSVTLIQGGNGTGKSSLLDILRYTFGRRTDGSMRGIEHDAATMLRRGCEEGESVVEFDDGTAVRCVVKRESTTRMMRLAGETRWDRSVEKLAKLVDAVGYDPLALMDMDDKEFRTTLERLFPPAIDTEPLEAALQSIEGVRPRNGKHPLDWLAECHDVVYRRRRDLNVAAESKEKHASEVSKAVSPGGEDVNRALDAAIAENAKAAKTTAEAKASARAAAEKAKTDAKAQFDAEVEAARKRMEEAQAASIGAIRAEFGPVIAAAEELERESAAKVSALRERADAAARHAGLIASANVALDAAGKLRAESEAMSSVLGLIRELKQNAAPPVPGITWTETGEPAGKDGVPRSQWNTERHMRQCIQIAMRVHAEAPFLVIDGAESIVGKNRTAMMRAAKKYADENGITFLIATAEGDGPLTVTEA